MKKIIMDFNLKNVDMGVWVRLVMLVISTVVYVCGVLGVQIPVIEENTVVAVLVAVFGIIAFLQAFWKNNSLTDAAQKADETIKELRENVR